MLKLRDFSVHQAFIGYTVVIGCQTLGFSTRAELATFISRYLNDPEQVEKEYHEWQYGEETKAKEQAVRQELERSAKVAYQETLGKRNI